MIAIQLQKVSKRLFYKHTAYYLSIMYILYYKHNLRIGMYVHKTHT